MKVVDIEKWERKAVYENFVKYTNPAFSFSVRLDVTALKNKCKQENRSFFAEFLFVVMQAVNSIPELKLRILDDKVVQFEKINASFIVKAKSGVIATCRVQMSDHDTFYAAVRKGVEDAKEEKQAREDFNTTNANDCVYVSCLPWTDFYSVINPYNFVDKEQSSIPRLTWGKYVVEEGRYKMFFDVSCHHALLDGEPVCRFINLLQDKLNEF